MLRLHVRVDFASGVVQELDVNARKTLAMIHTRFCTFLRLEEKHTCCSYRYSESHVQKLEADAHGQSFEAAGGTVM